MMDAELIRVAQKIERTAQMQWTDYDYLEGGHSVYDVWSLDEEDTDGLIFSGTYTEPEIYDTMPKLDGVNGGSLIDVAQVLHDYGKITAAEVETVYKYTYGTGA